jgi:hydrogenase maturation protease
MTAAKSVHVLVCGNPDRADDGAALCAVRSLVQRGAGRRRVEFERCAELDINHLLELPADEPVVIVDTAIGVRPGRVVTIPLDDLIDHPLGPAPRSSHALPINLVLGVANVLTATPLKGVFVGVGGADFGYGANLSAPVRRSLPRFIAAIDAAIDTLPLAAPRAAAKV